MYIHNNETFVCLISNYIPPLDVDNKKWDFILDGFRNILLRNYNKYTALKDYLFGEINLLPYERRQEMLLCFCSIQRHWFNLMKFVNICKFNYLKNKYPETQYDLYFNELSDFPNSKKITLMECGRLYTFKLSDLLHIMRSNLINNEELFLAPTMPKNPFTNLPFAYHNIYNLYFHSKKHEIAIPKVFQYFFYCDFSLKDLVFKYEPILRDCVLDNFCQNMSERHKYETILHIVASYTNLVPFVIHKEYPINRVVKLLGCTIVSYMKSEYSLNVAVREHNKFILTSKLQTLYSQTKNKNFGQVTFDVCSGRIRPIEDIQNTPYTFINPTGNNFVFGDILNQENTTQDDTDDDMEGIQYTGEISNEIAPSNAVNSFSYRRMLGRRRSRIFSPDSSSQEAQLRLREMLAGED